MIFTLTTVAATPSPDVHGARSAIAVHPPHTRIGELGSVVVVRGSRGLMTGVARPLEIATCAGRVDLYRGFRR
jgi:hypothetical protein